MHFLDVGSFFARHGDDMVGVATLQTLLPAQRDCDRAFFPRGFESAQHVFGPATRRDADDGITHYGQSLDLALEQRAVSEIVGDAGDDSRIANERDRRQGPPCLLEAANQFFYEVAGLSRAASVSERENLPAAREAGDDGIRGRVRCGLERSDGSSDDFLMLGEMLGEVLCWHARIIRV